MADLLIELLSEEIPARMQARAAEDLKRLVTEGLVAAGLTYAGAAAFATPRRLALAVDGLPDRSPTSKEERKGPRTDAPDQALDGFLRATGLTRDRLVARDTGKGEVWFAAIERPGRPAAGIVAEVLEAAIRDFPWPKSMRWGAGTLRWVRPLHSILCILTTEAGAEVVPFDVDGIAAANTTEGHRFMAPGRFAVASFEDYAAKLKRAHVILDPAERAEHIWHDATQAAFAQGLEVVEDKGLLAEVAGLVEWPVVLMGEIGEAFLGLPPEVLRTSMKEHQKFFSVKDKTGRIVRFVTVANVETADHGATILAGNRKVLSARLSDARFFWENDLRTIKAVGMTGMAAPLRDVTFHNKLGSQAERIERIAALAREIAPVVGAKPDLAEEAARIAKADLASEMVYEFPELQGIMGRYYAQAAGHGDGMPEACEEHYSPLGPNDAVPTHPVSVAVALADKIDTLTGFWAIDEKPTGSKDPFALRRAALGVIRLVLENGVRFDFARTAASAVAVNLFRMADSGKILYLSFFQLDENTGRLASQVWSRLERIEIKFDADTGDMIPLSKLPRTELKKLLLDSNLAWESDVVFLADGGTLNSFLEDESRIFRCDYMANDLLAFLHDRLKVYLRDRGIRHDVIDACLAMPNADDLTLLVKRAEALQGFLDTEDGTNLLQGFRRAHNILTQAEAKDGVEYSYGPDPKLAQTPEETALFKALDAAEARIAPAMQAEDFAEAMSAMAALRAPIDAFFEAVQVNTDSQIVRRNRLNLLHRISAACRSVADLTRIEG